jgi:hypothetical protein
LIEIGDDNDIHPFAAAYNGGAGIAMKPGGAGNNLAAFFYRNNAGLPVDLGDDGHTANDPGDLDGGPNTLLNYPEITGISGSIIAGTTCANCTVLIYVAHGNPAAPGGGASAHEFVLADAAGTWSFDLGDELNPGEITLQARDPSGNTSEFSPRHIIYLPLVLS